jgi:hypothetical protein
MAWFREKRDAGVRVTGKAMPAEALRLHKENGSQSCKASLGWFSRNLRIRITKLKNLSTRSSTMDVECCATCVDLLNVILCRFLNLSNQPSDALND